MNQEVKKYVLLFTIALIWGGQFMLNEWALESFPPFSQATYRILIGALTLSLIVRLGRKKGRIAPQQSINIKLSLILIALFDVVLPLLLIAWGQTHIASSMASLLMGTIPIFTMSIAFFMFKPHKINTGELLTVLIGFAGIYVLFSKDIGHTRMSDMLGPLAVLLGAISFALAMNLIKRLPESDSPFVITRDILIYAGVLLLPFALFIDQPWTLSISTKAWVSIVLLGVIGSAVVYILFVMLIRLAGPTFGSLANYLAPVFGVFNGVIFLNERFSVQALAALLILFVALGANTLYHKLSDKKS